MKTLSLRRADRCAACGALLAVGTKAVWNANARMVTCVACSGVLAAPFGGSLATVSAAVDVLPVDEWPVRSVEQPAQSTAGSSAQAEYDRRSQRREQAIRSRHPRLGGLILALSNEPASTRVWAQGARGERAVGAKLDELADGHLQVLHDRKMIRQDGRASWANIDHIAVAPSGVWVVDAKTYQGQLEVRRSGGLFSPRVEKLFIGGRDKTSLLDGLARQVDAVRAVLLEVGADVPVRGMLCFVGTELPWFGDSIGGVPLVGRRGMAKQLKTAGDLAADDRAVLATFLDGKFVPA